MIGAEASVSADPGVAVAGTLLLMAVDFDDGVINIEERVAGGVGLLHE